MRHEEQVLEPRTCLLLREMGRLLRADFFLAGGTALAIQIGHRRSINLDFFTSSTFDPDSLLARLRGGLANREIVILGRAENTLNLVIDRIKTDLIRYQYPLLSPVLEAGDYQMLGIPDIAAMKLAAVTNRGSKKDFFDIYTLLQHHTLKDLLKFYTGKFPDHDPFFVIRSLGFFDDADTEPDPRMIVPLSWQEVKQAIGEQLREIC